MPDIALYAPLKSPDHPVPSGERAMARNLMAAIGAGWDRGRVRLASDLRSHDPTGDSTVQARIFAEAAGEVERLTRDLAQAGTALWVTYHNYYKAPDLLGPAVSAALGIPYVIVEASRAKSRLTGPWARFAQAAEAASDAASAIFHVTDLDREALERDRAGGQVLGLLRPFLPADHLPPAGTPQPGHVLSVGMLRSRDKLGSYRIIAQVLAALQTPDWTLEIAGDGPARGEVAALMAPFGDRVRFLGQLGPEALAAAYARATAFLWPGFNEAYGMVYLEAQAAGVPVVAQDRDGVRDVLAPAEYPAPSAGPAPLAAMLDRLLGDPALRASRAAKARTHIQQRHLIGAATRDFWALTRPLLEASA